MADAGDWREKMRDPEIVARWRKEGQEQQDPCRVKNGMRTPRQSAIVVLVNDDHCQKEDHVLDEWSGYPLHRSSCRDQDSILPCIPFPWTGGSESAEQNERRSVGCPI